MAAGLFKLARRRSVTSTRHNVAPVLLEDAFRRGPLSAHEALRANGDDTPFVSAHGLLRNGGGYLPVVLAASEIAVHIVEEERENSAVSSYNRLLRFDTRVRDDGVDGIEIGICSYVGQRKTAEMIALGAGFAASELAFYVLEMPRTPQLDDVIERIQVGFDIRGVPESAHAVGRFLY